MQGKHILIVGASSGIGAELAEKLLYSGANVYSASRNMPSDTRIQHLFFDAQQPDISVFDTLPTELDGIVYAAGTINLKPFNRLSAADFERDYQVNVGGAIKVLQANLVRLKKAESGASVVFFSTVAVKVGMAFHASVAAAKGAIEGLTRALAAELAPNNIRVNCIAPSLTDTPLAKNLLSSDEKKEAAAKRHPLGRYGMPNDIAQAAFFLLNSEQSGWVTGQIIAVDGGMGVLK